MTRAGLQAGALRAGAAVLACACAAGGQSIVQWVDPGKDATLRPTDPGGDGMVLDGATLPELVHVSLAGWQPADASSDPFAGSVVPGDGAHFVRLTVTFRGLINPPGPLAFQDGVYDPYRFGDNPAYGFLDIDVDADVDTGGELDGGVAQRYLANVARFGRVPTGPLAARTAVLGEQVDGNFDSDPQVERSGADFSLPLCGCWDVQIVSENGDQDGIFDAGETWIVRGRFFERTRGYKEASLAKGGSDFGLYDPPIDVRYAHSQSSNATTITVVYPLDMAGAAMLFGEEEQDFNDHVDDHFSVAEALWDVIFYTENVGLTYPTSVLAGKWEGRSPFDYIDPTEWKVTALFGMPYIDAGEDAFYAWTDTGMAEVWGDLNGDGVADELDEDQLIAAVYALDGGPDDADADLNGIVVVPDPGLGFNMFDLDGDGEIQLQDRYVYGDPADINEDGSVDLLDFVSFQNLVHTQNPGADFNLDQAVNVFDFIAFQSAAGQ